MALNSVTFVAPSWDNEMYYQCMFNGTLGLRQYSLPTLTATLSTERTNNAEPGWGVARMAPFGGEVNTNTPPSWWPSSNWVRNDINVNALSAAPNGLVVLYSKSAAQGTIPVPEAAEWYVGVLNRSTGATLWESRLPNVGTDIAGEPLFEGLAVDRNGYIIVAQRNGNVLCYGTGAVHVAGRDPLMPSATPANATARGSAWTQPPDGAHNAPLDPRMKPVTPAPENETAYAVVRNRPKGGTLLTCILDDPGLAQSETELAKLAAADLSDMRMLDSGAMVHTLPPTERLDMIRDTVHEARMTWAPSKECLEIAHISASSSGRPAHDVTNAIDRDLRTRWSPAIPGDETLTIDLGTAQTVTSASIVWFGRQESGQPVSIGLSLDGNRYDIVDEGVLSGQGTMVTTRAFLPQDARFVQLTFAAAEGAALPVVQEVGVHGEQARHVLATEGR
jgi:hypothetical protein